MNNGVSLEDARRAKARAAEVFQSLVGPVATGIVRLGDDSYGLKVNLTTAPSQEVSLPEEIDGVPIQVEVVGKIRKR